MARTGRQTDRPPSADRLLPLLLMGMLMLQVLCGLEFSMMAALGRHLNPPTYGTAIHHLLTLLLPDTHRYGQAGRQRSWGVLGDGRR